MKSRTVMLLAVAALSLVACTKNADNTPAPSGSGAALTLATPSAATKSGSCVDGAYKDPTGIYCVKLPEGYKPPKATRKSGSESVDQFETDDGFNFLIKYWKPTGNNGDFDSTKAGFLIETDTVKKVTSSDFEGGNGFYIEMHDKGSKQTHTSAVVKSGSMLLTCEASTLDSKPMKPADACKTLRGM